MTYEKVLELIDKDTELFLGDTLFLGGCGRFFEGDATQMHKALVQILGQLPGQTVSIIDNQILLTLLDVNFEIK